MGNFKELDIKQFQINPFEIKNKWMLISAVKDGVINTMTASWGGFGIMWNKEVVFVVIRPQRYTKEFVDHADRFSLAFFDETKYHKDLAYLGKVSGKDGDKIAKTNLTPSIVDGVPHFEEAELILETKKLYVQRMTEESFLEEETKERWYPTKDFHFLYIAEIEKVLQNNLKF